MPEPRNDITVQHQLTATNGEPIVVEEFIPRDAPRGAVLIVPAIGTRARYYASVARWLCGEGYRVYTFDYQGYGSSATGPLTRVEADLFTWADDARVVLDQVRAENPDLPVTWLGHSLGGQLLPFVDHAAVDRAIFVASGTGYWRRAEGVNRWVAPVLWYAVVPVLTRVLGYFPGRRLGVLGDLPAPVVEQWAGWCTHPDYLLGEHPEHAATFAAVTTPITSISVTDDTIMSAASTAHLERLYRRASLSVERLSPSRLGTDRIDHMGFFAAGGEQRWSRVLSSVLDEDTGPRATTKVETDRGTMRRP